MKKLEEYEMSASQWLVTARQLAHHLTHHLDEEETQIFPVAGKALGEDQKTELAAEYRADMERHLNELKA